MPIGPESTIEQLLDHVGLDIGKRDQCRHGEARLVSRERAVDQIALERG